MIRTSSLIIGGVCLCNAVPGEEAEKSTCCFTPTLDEESYSIGPDRILIDLTKAEPLKESGCAAQVVNRDENVQIIIVKTGETTYAALSRLCTHGGQGIFYNSKQNILQCGNYNHSIFDLDGQVVKGPAPRPLQKYETKLEGNKLIVLLNQDE